VRNVINKPVVSRSIAFMYGTVVAFITALTIFFSYTALFTAMGTSGIVAAIGVIVVDVLILLIFKSLYTTKYILTENELKIKTTILIGGSKTIPLDTVDSVESTLIPFWNQTFWC
jgi:uncharacterized membrane protein YdbT with pleckstrin-like domain